MSVPLQLLAGPEWSQVVKTLLHSLWQGALITGVLALAMRRVVNSHWRYRFSLTALAAIPVAGIITWAVLNASNRPLPIVASPPVITEATTRPTALNPDPQTKVVLLTNHSPAPPPLHWTAWLALLWIVGAGAMLGRAGIKLAGAEQLRRSGQPLESELVAQLLAEARRAVGLTQRIRVAVTDKLTSPAVVGVLVPTLMLPLSLISTLTPDQIRFILLHELAHIRRGDYFANLFQIFIEALLFFNPAVWWISHQVRREREACCDALAIELSGAPADYARTLIHVAENVLEPAPAVAPAFGGEREPSSLADRVQRLLVPGYRPSLRLTWRAMIGAFVLGATLLLLSAEGTRVAVAQIAKTTQEKEESSPPYQLEGTLSADNSLLDPDHFTNQFNLGEPNDPVSIGPRIPVNLRFFRTYERDGVLEKLHAMRFQLVVCSNKPLGELFRELSEQSEALDKDGVGFRFSVIPIRLRALPTTIDPPLTNASLLEILAAIQGVPQLRLNGVGTNGLVTLQTVASLAQSYPKNKTEVETGQRQPPENAIRSIQTNSPSATTQSADRFAIGDMVSIRFSGASGVIPSHEEHVKEDGTITLPFIGEIMAAGKTSTELEKQIHDGYVPAYYKRLTVVVTNEESVPFVGGRAPVRQVYHGATTSAKAIQSAGDFVQRTDRPASSELSRPSKINPPPIEISGSTERSRVDYDTAEGKTVASNGGIVRFKDTTIRADSIQLNQKTGDLVASGNVRVERPGDTNELTRVELNIYSNQPPARKSEGQMLSTNEKKRAIASKLNGIVLDRAEYDSEPLSNVIRAVSTEVKRHDPEGGGVNIIINPNALSPDDGRVVDIGGTIITLQPPLTNVRLMDALNAILKCADKPLKLIIEEYGVTISLMGKDEPSPLFMRTFNLDQTALANCLAEKGYHFENPNNSTNIYLNAESIRGFLASAGINLQPMLGKSIYYNYGHGLLLIRATMDELDQAEQLLNELNRPEPKINIKTRFVEVSPSELETFLPDFKETRNAVVDQSWTGILTKSQESQIWQCIQTGKSVSLLSDGEVTTVSSRRAQVQVVEIKTIVTDINPKALTPPGIISTNKDGSGESLFITTTNLPFGATIDIVPAITPDGYNVALTVIPRVTEFLGYDGVERPTNTVAVYENGKKGKATYPLPRFRTQQMTNSAVVRDGMTLMLAFPPVQKTITTKDKVPGLGDIPGVGRLFRSQSSQTRTNILFVLVTPTIVAPAAK